MSILLTGTTESLQVVLDAAPATNQLPCTASYADQNGSGGDNTVNTNGTTPVTLVASPAASVSRVINDVVIPNADTATRIVTVNKVISGTPFRLVRITLLAGYSLGYGGGRWYVIDPSGNFLESVQAQQSGSWSVSIAGTPNVNLADVGGSAISLGQKAMATSMPVVIASDQSNVPENLTQVGGSSITLGTKTAANSIPVVQAYDTSGSSLSSVIVSTTASSSLGLNARNFLRSLQIISVGPVLAAGSVSLTIKDGSGTPIYAVTLPVATGTATQPFTIIDFKNIMVAMNNGGNPVTVSLGTNLTSGSFLVSISGSVA